MFELLQNNLLFSIPLLFVISLLSLIIIFSFIGFDILHMDFSDIFFLGWSKGETPVIFSLLTGFLLFGFMGLFFIKLNIISAIEINVLVSCILAFIGTRFIYLKIFRHLPKEESYAISSKALIGEIVIVINNSESKDLFTEAKFIDKFGTTHYILVKSDNNTLFSKGDKILLVAELNSKKFIGIKSIDN